MKNQIRGSLYLTIAALVWGMAFAAQSTAMDHVGPFAFTAARSLISCAVLAVFLPMLRKFPGMADGAPRAAYIKLGLPLGAILFAAVALQQAGLMSTSSAKSGFITALYIVIVPILGMFLGRRVRANVWVSVVLALAGLCLLTLKEDFSIQSGDLLTLGCAIVFSFHILAVDRYAGGLNAAKLCCIQFGVTGVLALLATILFEHADFSGLSG